MTDRWEHRFDTKPARTGMWVITGVIVFVVAVGGVLWGLGVITSPVRGAGDAYAQKNSAGNWITAQKQFQSDAKTFQVRLVQIADASKAVKAWQTGAHPTDGIAAYTDGETGNNLRTTLTGLTTGCQNIAATYNTDSHAYLSQQFKDADLPDQLDPTACSTAAS
jgi:hypothetical protein